jgi:uncharacterized protein YecT (DUF1311 family)
MVGSTAKEAPLRTTVLCFALCIPSVSIAQSPPETTTPTPEQVEYRAAGKSALSDEHTRESNQQCTFRKSGLDSRTLDACMEHEFKLTQKNYQAYMHAVSELMHLGGTPRLSQSDPSRSFQKAELQWTAYRDLECGVAANLHAGDVPGYSYYNCEQRLTRAHLDEIAHLYPDLW